MGGGQEPSGDETMNSSFGDNVKVAADGNVAVVNGRSSYFKDSSRRELTKEWYNIFVIEFDGDGRCRSFREWYVARRGQAE